MLCPDCHKISAAIQDLLKVASYGLNPVPHILSLGVLKASAKHGCELCRLLLQAIRDQVGERAIRALSAKQQALSYQIDRYFAGGQLCIESITFFIGYSDNPRQLRMFEASFRVELLQSGMY